MLLALQVSLKICRDGRVQTKDGRILFGTAEKLARPSDPKRKYQAWSAVTGQYSLHPKREDAAREVVLAYLSRRGVEFFE